jgi:uncharacterized protein involved in exopolysaccharide biosynthesis
MAKVDGTRTDETAQPSSQRTGPEKWMLVVIAIVALAVLGALLALAGGG